MNTFLRAVIVEDEPHSTLALTEILHQYCHNIRVVGTAACVEEAVRVIDEVVPDVVFLDIELPPLNGFEVLERCKDRDELEVIITTAYNSFAREAIKAKVTDYLYKPIDIDQLEEALLNVRRNIQARRKTDPQHDVQSNNGLKIRTIDEVLWVPKSEILYFKTEGSYTSIVFESGRPPMMVCKTSGYFEKMLKHDRDFTRANRAYIVRSSKITRIAIEHGLSLLELNNGHKITITPARRDELLEVLGLIADGETLL